MATWASYGYVFRTVQPSQDIVIQGYPYGPTNEMINGTVSLPIESDVKETVTYGPSNTLTGTLTVGGSVSTTSTESWS